MKGILLAGGSGSRLFPLTSTVCKQLLPVYDKPMIHYPLATLMLAGIREILVISTPQDLPLIQAALGTGAQFGLKLSYVVQAKPEGIAQAFLLAESFLQGSPVCLILGDNLFYGESLKRSLESAAGLVNGARIFAYRVNDPERYGVVKFGRNFKAESIVEKPSKPESPWAVTGLYFYDSKVVDLAKRLRPSGRGELEITDLNRLYLERGELEVEALLRGVAWLDTGTVDSLLSASVFVQTLEKRQGLKIGCVEETALRMGFTTPVQLEDTIRGYGVKGETPYAGYLKRVLEEVRSERAERLSGESYGAPARSPEATTVPS